MAKNTTQTQAIRHVADLEIDTNLIDLQSGMRLEELTDKDGNIAAENIPEVVRIVSMAVIGGTNGVPYAEKRALLKKVFEALVEAGNPKSTPPDGG